MKESLTDDERAAIRARLADKAWRMRNLYLILDEAGQVTPLRLRDEQRQFLKRRHTRNFVPKARKLGMSTIIVLDYLDECLWNPHSVVGHIDLRAKDAYDKLQIARFAWEQGPNHPDPGIAEVWRSLHRVNPLTTDNDGELAWKNGSRQTAGTGYTGKTPTRLHVSEYGPIASQFPRKAAGIKRGSMNAVPATGIVDVETTMEGGRFGECYALFKLALGAAGKDRLTALDWLLHFFPWWNHPSYRLEHQQPHNADTLEYFAELKAKHGIELPPDRMAWWEIKRKEQGEDMWQQFPSVVEECDRHVVAGQIYPELTTLRARRRVREFEPEPHLPMFTFWDLGSSNNTAGWLIQPAGKDHNWLDWSAGEGLGAGGVAAVIRAWEAAHGPLDGHFLPHDAEITDKGSGKTYKAQLIEAGVPSHLVHVVPRTPDIWVGIGELRKLLPNSWFHSRCDRELRSDTGAPLPSGVGRLESYRLQPATAGGVLREAPLHDICSHTADAARTYAEAQAAGLVRGSLTAAGRREAARVVSGFRPAIKRGVRTR